MGLKGYRLWVMGQLDPGAFKLWGKHDITFQVRGLKPGGFHAMGKLDPTCTAPHLVESHRLLVFPERVVVVVLGLFVGARSHVGGGGRSVFYTFVEM
jgi:hypothetical protein